jgi:hypothetical protein
MEYESNGFTQVPTNSLADAIKRGREQRESYSDELKVALAFAGTELAELKAGIRTFAQCPGLARIGVEIVRATTHIKPADER